MADLSVLPSVEKLAAAHASASPLPRPLLVAALRQEIAQARHELEQGASLARADIKARCHQALQSLVHSRLQPMLNGTGVLIHTNLGRSPLGATRAQSLAQLASGYCNIELDLTTGKRGSRGTYVEKALATLLNAPAATVVNNCAAALVVTLRSLLTPERREVIVSRSELVEIGGGFRVPDILETSGATLVEVGTTNKTHLPDYQRALSERTALILKVHRSNFFLGGFTSEPDVPALAELAHQAGIPLVEDLGSGALMHTDQLAPIEHEPTPQEALRRGIDLVTFSGDKLLGGPQSGLIAGRADLVTGIKKDPFFRAVRCDKLILVTLQELLEDYLHTRQDPTRTKAPVLELLATPLLLLEKRAHALIQALSPLPLHLEITPSTARTGGGTMPRSEIPSLALRLSSPHFSSEELAQRLRTGQPAVMGSLQDDHLLLDLRTLFPEQDAQLLQALQQAATPDP